MVKRKEFKQSGEENTVKQPELEENEEIIELDEVIEEPEFLPVGEGLDELLKANDSPSDIDFDIEKLDEELGIDFEETIEEELGEIKVEDTLEIKSETREATENKLEASPPSVQPSSPSSQDTIDELFKEALLETATTSIDEGTPASRPVEAPAVVSTQVAERSFVAGAQQELERAVEELENRIMARFEAFIQQQLPVIVLETVRAELKSLLKELEEQKDYEQGVTSKGL